MTLRRATTRDASILASFASTAFWDTYRAIDNPDDIADYVTEHFSVEAVAAVIADPSSVTLLACAPGLAGYAVLRNIDAPACVSGAAPLELARLYLARGLIGRGYGARLMRAIHAEARRLGAQTLWLGVYDRNHRAVRFYERFGFARVGDREFMFGGRACVDPIYVARVRNDA
ncbi:MAG: GNAT family N-acetyltransferase [Gammaproteobacteria bacterium]